jgi:hypothetical protein
MSIISKMFCLVPHFLIAMPNVVRLGVAALFWALSNVVSRSALQLYLWNLMTHDNGSSRDKWSLHLSTTKLTRLSSKKRLKTSWLFGAFVDFKSLSSDNFELMIFLCPSTFYWLPLDLLPYYLSSPNLEWKLDRFWKVSWRVFSSYRRVVFFFN